MSVAREFHDAAVAQAEELSSAAGPQLSYQAKQVAGELEREGGIVYADLLCTPLDGDAKEFMKEHLTPGQEVAEPHNLVLALLDRGLDLAVIGVTGQQAWTLAARDVYVHEEETRCVDDNVVLKGLVYPRAVGNVRDYIDHDEWFVWSGRATTHFDGGLEYKIANLNSKGYALAVRNSEGFDEADDVMLYRKVENGVVKMSVIARFDTQMAEGPNGWRPPTLTEYMGDAAAAVPAAAAVARTARGVRMSP